MSSVHDSIGKTTPTTAWHTRQSFALTIARMPETTPLDSFACLNSRAVLALDSRYRSAALAFRLPRAIASVSESNALA